MLTLYYRIWADAIISAQQKKGAGNSCKLVTLVPVSALMGVNLFTLFLWMKELINHNLPLVLPVDILTNRIINGAISIVVTFFIPFVILNYLVVFSSDSYREILKKYRGENGRLYRRYIFISLGVLIIPVLIVDLYFKIV